MESLGANESFRIGVAWPLTRSEHPVWVAQIKRYMQTVHIFVIDTLSSNLVLTIFLQAVQTLAETLIGEMISILGSATRNDFLILRMNLTSGFVSEHLSHSKVPDFVTDKFISEAESKRHTRSDWRYFAQM